MPWFVPVGFQFDIMLARNQFHCQRGVAGRFPIDHHGCASGNGIDGDVRPPGNKGKFELLPGTAALDLYFALQELILFGADLDDMSTRQYLHFCSRRTLNFPSTDKYRGFFDNEIRLIRGVYLKR